MTIGLDQTIGHPWDKRASSDVLDDPSGHLLEIVTRQCGESRG